MLDCAAPLPSKKTTIERLKLNQYVSGPVMFFSGYGRDPKQLPAKILRNQYSLRKELTAVNALHAAKIKDTSSLYRKCLKKGKCGLVLKGSEMSAADVRALNEASDATPDFAWVVLDGSKLKLRKPSEKDLGLPKMTGSHRVILFKPAKPQEGDGEAATVILSSAPYLGSFTDLATFASGFAEQDSGNWKEVDSESLSVMKRKVSPQYRAPSAPSSSPSPEPEATILPTAQQEERRKEAQAKRAAREAAKRAEMDAAHADFIEYEGDEDDQDEDDEDEDDEDNDEDEDEDGDDEDEIELD